MMSAWQYRTVAVTHDDLDRELKTSGRNGWELVSIIAAANAQHLVVYKKQAASK